MQIVDRVLERGRIAVVVLGRDEHERIGSGYAHAPVLGVLVGVLAQAGVVWLVEYRQVELGEVDDVELEATVAASTLHEPVRDRKPRTTGTRGADDDAQAGHSCANNSTHFAVKQ